MTRRAQLRGVVLKAVAELVKADDRYNIAERDSEEEDLALEDRHEAVENVIKAGRALSELEGTS